MKEGDVCDVEFNTLAARYAVSSPRRTVSQNVLYEFGILHAYIVRRLVPPEHQVCCSLVGTKSCLLSFRYMVTCYSGAMPPTSSDVPTCQGTHLHSEIAQPEAAICGPSCHCSQDIVGDGDYLLNARHGFVIRGMLKPVEWCGRTQSVQRLV